MSFCRSCCLLAVTALFPLVGCVSVPVPEDFLVVHETSGETQAVTSDQGRFWVREFANSQGADLEFWKEAVARDFVDNRGYTPVSQRAIVDAADRNGHEALYEATIQGIPHRYLLAIFVTKGWWSSQIRVIEFAAPVEEFEAQLASVREAISRLGR